MNQRVFDGLLQQLTNLSDNQRQRLHSQLKTHGGFTSEMVPAPPLPLQGDAVDQNPPSSFTPKNLNGGTSLPEASKFSACLRERLVEVMALSLRYWIQTTRTTKLELAEQSGLWTAVADKEGTWRTRTLNRYLQVSKLPKNPRWRQVLQTAYFALQQCPNQAPQLRTELESKLKNLERLLQTKM